LRRLNVASHTRREYHEHHRDRPIEHQAVAPAASSPPGGDAPQPAQPAVSPPRAESSSSDPQHLIERRRLPVASQSQAASPVTAPPANAAAPSPSPGTRWQSPQKPWPDSPAVDVEDLTERVLRSIERRARAQRERLGVS
jgi:hypothetical protein